MLTPTGTREDVGFVQEFLALDEVRRDFLPTITYIVGESAAGLAILEALGKIDNYKPIEDNSSKKDKAGEKSFYEALTQFIPLDKYGILSPV